MRVLKPKNIDLIRRANEDPVKAAKKKKKLLIILPLVLLVLALVGFEGWNIYRIKYELQPQIDKLNEYVENEQVLTEYDAAMQLISQRDTIQFDYDNLVLAKTAIDSYPEFTVSLNAKLEAAARQNDVTIGAISFNRASGALSFGASTPDMENVPNFIKALKATLAFGDNVFYNGESWQDGGAYAFSVACTVAEG